MLYDTGYCATSVWPKTIRIHLFFLDIKLDIKPSSSDRSVKCTDLTFSIIIIINDLTFSLIITDLTFSKSHIT